MTAASPAVQNNLVFGVRIKIIRAVLFLVGLAIVAAIIRIQVTREDLITKDTYPMTFYPERGQIYDRWGSLLAGNRQMYEIDVNIDILEKTGNQIEVLTFLRNSLGIDYTPTYQECLTHNENAKTEKDIYIYCSLDRYVEPEKIDYMDQYIEEYRTLRQDPKNAKRMAALHLNGLEWWPRLVRTYPEGMLASNVLGFVAFKDSNDSAHYGVEERYNEQLAGKPRTFEVPADPNKITEIPKVPAGTSLVLTIDRQIQDMVEKILDNAVANTKSDSGTIIVMDPETGEILAMAVTPRMDPNHYWDELKKFPNQGDYNRAVGTPYEPGSIFKILTMVSAFDSNVITPETTWNVPDVIYVGQSAIYNWDGGAWGMQSMTGCMEHSLNVCLATISKKMGNELFYDYLLGFGIGHATNIDLAGEIVYPLLTPGDTYLTVINDQQVQMGWTEDNLGTNSFGQGLATTPIQMITAISAAANDGKIMAPHVVKAMIQDGRTYEIQPRVMLQPISEASADAITNLLTNSLKGEGEAALVENYTLAGKTGTAEIAIPGEGYTSPLTNASFVGWGPSEDPKFLVYVWLEKPKTEKWASLIATPIFAEVVRSLVVYMNIPPDDVRLQLYNH
jgi:cell division protein FtsI/penicillin-binding protein 2